MLYADLTIFFVNVVQIVAHFHIKYREKVYIFWGLIQHNEKSCTNKLNSKSFVHLFKGGGFPKVLKSLYEATAYELQLS